ncbi:hypothetical protein ACU6U9_02555 [Pseudomonas sp. HK3]
MDNDIQDEQCSVCNGSGHNPASSANENELGNINYVPIQCPHCNGTGIEPE